MLLCFEPLAASRCMAPMALWRPSAAARHTFTGSTRAVATVPIPILARAAAERSLSSRRQR